MSKSYLIPHSFSRIDVATSIDRVVSVNNTFTATSTESGNFIILNSTTGSIVSVPNAGTGLDLTFIVGVTAANHVITFPTGTLFGNITQGTAGNITVSGTNTSVTSSTSGSVGDRFKVVSDGTKFYINGSTSKANGVSFA